MSSYEYIRSLFPDIRKSTGRAMVSCIFHTDRTPSLSLSLDTYRFKCFSCGRGGDLIDLHRELTGCDFKTALQAVTGGSVALPAWQSNKLPTKDEAKDRKKQVRAQRLWDESRPIIKGDAVSNYLANRGLNLDRYPASLRYHPSLDYFVETEGNRLESLGQFPAMLARVDGTDDQLQAVHRTYLTADGYKANVPAVRKISGSPKGGAIKLLCPGPVLAIAEGVETALAYHLITGHPVWSCISTSLMNNLIVPGQVNKVIICVDVEPSGAGQRASLKLASRLHNEGISVQMAIPPGQQAKRDFNDYLRELKHAQQSFYQSCTADTRAN